MLFEVGIDKAYFPKELRPSDTTSIFERVKVRADSRRDAAQKAWRENGERWLSLMNPKETSIRKISLHVNDPKAGVGGKLGRLSTIPVHEE